MEKATRFNIWYVLITVMVVALVRDFWTRNQEIKHVPYSEFEAMLEKGSIEEVVLTEKEISAQIKEPKEGQKFIHTNRVDLVIADKLQKYGVKYSMKIENTIFRDIMSWVFPILIMFALWSFLARKMSAGLHGGVMSVGKSKAKIYVETDTKVTFDDVAGADEAEAELKEIVEFLKDPKKFERLGGRMPKGVLLVGPPGTGKTLIAKAVAGEAGVPFFSTNGAEFVEMFVGVGAARVRDLFEQAKSKAPCIIFIDELDALGKVRMVTGLHGNDEKEQTLNQLLAELDGFDSRSGIVLLAATNRPEILDPALLRSGGSGKWIVSGM